MVDLINTIKRTITQSNEYPFTVFTSIKEQKILNVPIVKPMLIIVLSGQKELMFNKSIMCYSGEFLFLSNRSGINMRNIPKNNEYFALLIEFNDEDFSGININTVNKKEYYIGVVEAELEICIQQFVEMAQWAPKELWTVRKKEIISLLIHLGHHDITNLVGNPQLKDKVQNLFIKSLDRDLTTKHICSQLAVSESTLRRKLKLEGTSIQDIKDRVRLTSALNLLQTTGDSIGLIADKCGYQSQSRFTDRFKKRFGITPSDLRKTQMTE
jgi:AraC-like DNA-binding protein